MKNLGGGVIFCSFHRFLYSTVRQEITLEIPAFFCMVDGVGDHIDKFLGAYFRRGGLLREMQSIVAGPRSLSPLALRTD